MRSVAYQNGLASCEPIKRVPIHLRVAADIRRRIPSALLAETSLLWTFVKQLNI